MNISKRHFNTFYTMWILSLLLLFFSCSGFETADTEVSEENLTELRIKVMSDSADLNALRNYAIMLVKDKQNLLAQKYLNKALTKMPLDEELLFNQGLNFEFLNNNYSALQAYSNYPMVPEKSIYYELMRGRFLLLSREVASSEIKDLVRKEESIDISKISGKNLAVFPLTYLGTNQKYEPLSSGLSEMISIDLGKVKELTVLERIRLQAVLDELKFGKTDFVDRASAPRMGKLLSAGKLYKGAYNISETGNIFLEINSWDVFTNTMEEVFKNEVSLTELFAIEKEIVFNILYQLGIELTPQEKEEIEYIPTKNMNAFLAYSRGLELELEGNFGEAAQFFNNAVEFDPKFKNAANKVSSSRSMSNSSGTKENVLTKTSKIKTAGTQAASGVDQRLETLGGSIESGFTNSIDNREPAQEGQITTKAIAPPPPRPRKQ